MKARIIAVIAMIFMSFLFLGCEEEELPGPYLLKTPTNIEGRIPEYGKIELRWDDVENETGYELHRQRQKCFVGCWWTDWSKISDIPADTTEYTDNTVEAGQELYYRYRIRAYNKSGYSDWVHTYSK